MKKIQKLITLIMLSISMAAYAAIEYTLPPHKKAHSIKNKDELKPFLQRTGEVYKKAEFTNLNMLSNLISSLINNADQPQTESQNKPTESVADVQAQLAALAAAKARAQNTQPSEPTKTPSGPTNKATPSNAATKPLDSKSTDDQSIARPVMARPKRQKNSNLNIFDKLEDPAAGNLTQTQENAARLAAEAEEEAQRLAEEQKRKEKEAKRSQERLAQEAQAKKQAHNKKKEDAQTWLKEKVETGRHQAKQEFDKEATRLAQEEAQRLQKLAEIEKAERLQKELDQEAKNRLDMQAEEQAQREVEKEQKRLALQRQQEFEKKRAAAEKKEEKKRITAEAEAKIEEAKTELTQAEQELAALKESTAKKTDQIQEKITIASAEEQTFLQAKLAWTKLQKATLIAQAELLVKQKNAAHKLALYNKEFRLSNKQGMQRLIPTTKEANRIVEQAQAALAAAQKQESAGISVYEAAATAEQERLTRLEKEKEQLAEQQRQLAAKEEKRLAEQEAQRLADEKKRAQDAQEAAERAAQLAEAQRLQAQAEEKRLAEQEAQRLADEEKRAQALKEAQEVQQRQIEERNRIAAAAKAKEAEKIAKSVATPVTSIANISEYRKIQQTLQNLLNLPEYLDQQAMQYVLSAVQARYASEFETESRPDYEKASDHMTRKSKEAYTNLLKAIKISLNKDTPTNIKKGLVQAVKNFFDKNIQSNIFGDGGVRDAINGPLETPDFKSWAKTQGLTYYASI